MSMLYDVYTFISKGIYTVNDLVEAIYFKDVKQEKVFIKDMLKGTKVSEYSILEAVYGNVPTKDEVTIFLKMFGYSSYKVFYGEYPNPDIKVRVINIQVKGFLQNGFDVNAILESVVKDSLERKMLLLYIAGKSKDKIASICNVSKESVDLTRLRHLVNDCKKIYDNHYNYELVNGFVVNTSIKTFANDSKIVLMSSLFGVAEGYLKTKIYYLNLSDNLLNILKRVGFKTLGDVYSNSYEELMSIRGFGENQMKELNTVFLRYGLKAKKRGSF